ncbi:TPA: hypothetical protein N0F65_008198 [Lagenidium giganteum]|uniref:MULE transposase domain-containing protein n=1 Tax=Lagenidium giganteum TaxID=4803 RepID=A0AAV2YI15_9STRA|nr:TPA: hypothetical protein N0F65_008198 [Lagenidium giganteum]
MAQGKRAVLDAGKRGGSNFVFRCSSTLPCPLVVRVSKSQSAPWLSSFNGDHTGCVGKACPTCQPVQSLDVTRAIVTAQPAIAGRALMSHVQSTRGFVISQRISYQARDAIVDEQSEGVVTSFKQPDSEFDRAFIAHPYVHLHRHFGQRVLGVDGTFMKHGNYKSTLLLAVGRTGAGKNVVLGVGICNGESERNCTWFLQYCRAAGLQLTSLPVFADRGKGLIAVSRSPQNPNLVLHSPKSKSGFALAISSEMFDIAFQLRQKKKLQSGKSKHPKTMKSMEPSWMYWR